MTEGATLDEMVADMDAGDVEFAHVTAAIMGRVSGPTYGVGQDIRDQLFDALCRRPAELMQRFEPPVRFQRGRRRKFKSAPSVRIASAPATSHC